MYCKCTSHLGFGLAAVKGSFFADPGTAGEWVLYRLVGFASAGLFVLHLAILAGDILPRLLPSRQVYPPRAVETLREVLYARVYQVMDAPLWWLKKEE